MFIHVAFDLAAWGVAAVAGLWIRHRHGAKFQQISLRTRPGYWVAAFVGLSLGASLVAAANNGLAGLLPVGHSLAGALAGGILAVEIYKRWAGMRGSTGGVLVLPLCLGIAVGRIGCLLSGIDDYTYGTPTTLPWAWDFGDGVPRHPVPVYESLSMLCVGGILVTSLTRHRPIPTGRWFYLFCIAYGLQRFAWEFLKPYPLVLGPLNLYHLICLALACYGLAMLWVQGREAHA